MTAPDGRPTNACFGFISMLLKLAEDFKPDGIVCAFDKGIPEFRLKALREYKAQRPPTDPDLKVQFPMIQQLLVGLSIPVVQIEGWEGDDILGTLAVRGEEAGMSVLLVTGDKDALQLTSEFVSVVKNKKGMSEVDIFDPAKVEAEWGVPPARITDLLGLMGDTSDNIPGIPGVGPKKAVQLLQDYGTLEKVLAHGAEIKGKLGENVRANGDLARASKEVATIMCDVPLVCDLTTVSFPAFDTAAMSAVFTEFALTSQLRKLLTLAGRTPGAGSASGSGRVPGTGATPRAGAMPNAVSATGAKVPAKPAESPTAPAPDGNAPTLTPVLPLTLTTPLTLAPPITGSDAQRQLELACEAGSLLAASIDSEAGTSLFDSARHLYIATQNSILCFDDTAMTTALTAIVRRGTLITVDAKALLQELIPPNSSKACALDPWELDPTRIFDASLAAYLLDSSSDYRKVDALIERFTPGMLPEATEQLPQGALNAAALLSLHALLTQRLIDDGSMECYQRIEMPLVAVLVQIERWGMNVDSKVLDTLGAQLATTLATLRAQATAEAGEEFNLDSPKQLGVILFEKLKLPTIRKTRTGYSTDAAVLQELSGMHPLPHIMLEYRELAKLKSTYLDALPRLVASDQHIHTSLNQAVTATGRLSSSDPNLQNIPVRTDLGRQIRTAFIPDPVALGVADAVFLSADYSQIELRLLAHLSGDEGLIEAFLSGEDFHASTAARVFNVPVTEITPQLRSRAKAVNFGIVYGQQAFGLAQSLGVAFAEAQEMIKRYFAVYPQVRCYLDEVVELAREQGWVETLYGRKRHIHEIRSSNANLRGFGERTAMNHPMQGSAADIIKLAMIEVQRRLCAEGFVSQMILQVHDELDFNCAKSEADRLQIMVKQVMENVAELRVPLLATVSIGDSWATAH
jgi:DNA polymerase-1